MRKYGMDKFVITVQESMPGASEDMLGKREEFWVAELHTRAPQGYNMTGGGRGGVRPIPEVKAKTLAANLGAKRTAATKANIAASLACYWWIVVNPLGEVLEPFQNLGRFCVEHNLHSGAMNRVAQGKQRTHKGWTITKVNTGRSRAEVTTTTKNKLRSAFRGTPRSEETKAKLREFYLGKLKLSREWYTLTSPTGRSLWTPPESIRILSRTSVENEFSS